MASGKVRANLGEREPADQPSPAEGRKLLGPIDRRGHSGRFAPQTAQLCDKFRFFGTKREPNRLGQLQRRGTGGAGHADVDVQGRRCSFHLPGQHPVTPVEVEALPARSR